jgi:hypothetical protein
VKLKRHLILIVGICITAILAACTTAKVDNKLSLTDIGLRLINEVDTLAECEEYISLYSANEELADVIKGISDNDYKEPKAVFIIDNLDQIMYENMLSEIKLPNEIKNMVKDKFAIAVPSQLNAMNGATTVAATSILNHGDSFIFEGLHATTTYLYIFDSCYNFMVTYVPKDENIVNASVNVVINDDIGNCTNKEEINKFFRDKMSFESVSVSMATEEK